MFEEATGLKLMDDTGIKDELPPITTFLNRLLALTINLQGVLFTAFEQLLNAKIEGAIASGSYDVGLETLRAESFVVTDRQTIHAIPPPALNPAMRDGFDELKDRLLRAGVRPGAVSRYLAELQEHLEDVAEELRLSGLTNHEARDRALARLGSLDALALPMLLARHFR